VLFGRRVQPTARRLAWGHLIGLLAACLLWLAGADAASAHAHLVQANLAPDSVVGQVPAIGQFTFDEPLNAALTQVRITDVAGREVAGGAGRLAPGRPNTTWLLPLPRLANGVYSVFWTSESATDGHVMSSFYTFRVASGGSDSRTSGSVGAYGGAGAGGALLGLGSDALITALLHWLGLVAQALWLGALLIDLVVLPRSRRTPTVEARLAWVALPRLARLIRGSIAVTLVALLGEVLALALQGTGGDWRRALTPATLGGLLSSSNGHYTVARLALLLIALASTIAARTPASSPNGLASPRARLSWTALRLPLTAFAGAYMLLVALSGHAANVMPGWLSYLLDWLHLVCTAAWVGGIAALAYGVLPLRHTLPPTDRAPALLPLVQRFAPVAYLAVATLALSGLYNAVNHLASPAILFNSPYGQLLLVKLSLIGLMLLLSASHAYALRLRIGRAQQTTDHDAVAAAAVHEGLATLAARLRLEAGVGAAVLLATALMSQTLPASSSARPAPAATSLLASVARISSSATVGDLRATLTVAPPAVGSATFTISLLEKGAVLTENTAGALLHLYPVGRPALLASLTVTAHGARFVARGGLAMAGAWRADVLVRTVTVGDYRTVPFTFTVGPGAAFTAPPQNAAAITLRITPGQLAVANTVLVTGVQASALRLVSDDLDMPMGSMPYPATALGGGQWRVASVYPMMNGRWALTVEVERQGAWVALRRFIYTVPLHGPIRLLTSDHPVSTDGAPPRAISPGAVRWPGLVYRALVSFVDNGQVYVPSQQALTYVGRQNHSLVRAPDGTVWVTDYLGNRIAVLDPLSGHIIGSIAVRRAPVHIAFTPNGRRAYVSNFLSGDISVVDVRARRVVATIAVQLQPHGLAVTPDGRQVWAPCSLAGGIWVIDTRTNKVVSIVFTGGFPHAVAFAPDGRTAYLTDATPAGGAGLFVINRATGKVRARVAIGTGSAMVVASGTRVYVTGQAGSVLTVLDATTLRIVTRVPVGQAPHGLVFTPDKRLLYIAANGGRHVAVVDTRDNRVVATAPMPGAADEVALWR